MALTRIGAERWDFVDAAGREVKLPEAGAPVAALPERWRVFGPLDSSSTELKHRACGACARSVVSAPLHELRAVPATLEIGGRTLEGCDVLLEGGALDLQSLFGSHQLGQQAFLFAELELASEQEVAFGTGCDWWMQWWIDGEVVCDTMQGGNRHSLPGPADHCFRRLLAAGSHLLAIRLVSGEASWRFRASAVSAREEARFALTRVCPPQSDHWTFVPQLSEIHPPTREWTHTMAIAVDRCLADETIECEVRRGSHSGNAGIVFGAQDSGHYYWAQIPWHGQLARARGFWAAISKADGSGYIRNLALQLMPNVPAFAHDDWLSLRLQRLGDRMQMWVNGVAGPCVTDRAYGAGRVGIAGFSQYRVRNLRIDGRPAPAGHWPCEDRRVQPWFHIEDDLDLGDVQRGVLVCKTSDGAIHAVLSIGRDTSVHNASAQWRWYRYVSTDAGRTWSRRGLATESLAELLSNWAAPWFEAAPGVQRMVTLDSRSRSMLYWDSSDCGDNWTGPTPCRLLGDWGKEMLREGTRTHLNSLAELADGTLLAMLIHGSDEPLRGITDDTGMAWGAGPRCESWCSRSTDRGASWSEPVPTDYAASRPGETPGHPNIDFTENYAAELPGGRIVCLSRPYCSPFMWQTHSDDGGRTWSMACYAPFTGAGYPNVVATRSGYLVVVKRGPGLALNVSLDGGTNWDAGVMIDYTTIFNGRVIEVEPDVILVLYAEAMDDVRPAYVRSHRIRITPNGPQPLT